MLSAHFGHCENFALFDVDEQSKKILKKELVQPPPHEPGLLPKWLAEQGVNFIIAGGMGSRAQGLFQQNNIGVVMGTMESDPGKAVQNYLDGCLATGDNFCDH
jgi:predicted Fe-Mo cluster-binding NifX family protein